MIIQEGCDKYNKNKSYFSGVWVGGSGGSATTYATRVPQVPNIPYIKGNEQLKRILDAYFLDMTKFLEDHANNYVMHKID